MTRKTILVIAMMDSIHLARWLDQFCDQEIDFFLFPSRTFRKFHPKLKLLLENEKSVANYFLLDNRKNMMIAGYADYFLFNCLSRIMPFFSRAKKLENLLKRRKFDYIHAIEIQGAGYLLTKIDSKFLETNKVIVTNWGSDIFYFRQFSDHLRSIKEVLKIADFYSAECLRDYHLARELGFVGIDLPCIPNAGGFNIDGIEGHHAAPSTRSQILIKGYGGQFGRADIPISLLTNLSCRHPQLSFHVYSATKDTIKSIKALPREVRSKIRVTRVGNRLSQEEIFDEFRKSRIYVGCSESDGVSTSFLEAMINGAYPIQSKTSCANELVQKGACAAIVGLSQSELWLEIEDALRDDVKVDLAAKKNLEIAKNTLSTDVVKVQALKFYR